MEKRKIVIIGGGPAGLSAAIAARKAGISDILILERDHRLGGILNQCIHSGFGLHRFGEELTGPEYAQRLMDEIAALGIEYRLGAMVTELTKERMITYSGREWGLCRIQADAVILAMGCRERPRGAMNIAGDRPAGVYSAGTAQYMINMEGRLPGREIVILGSGDIGLIMARRLTLEGAHVRAVAEIMPHAGGLQRNVAQCLDDFGIPLLLRHTVVEIRGRERVRSVVLAEVDENRRMIPGTEREIECDTLLLSVGLIPENELSEMAGLTMDARTRGPVVYRNMETMADGIFACGNVLHVHDLADHVSDEADLAGAAAAAFVLGNSRSEDELAVFNTAKPVEAPLQDGETICIRCPKGCRVRIREQNGRLVASGQGCKRGKEYALQEHATPMRVVTASVDCDGERVSVRTDDVPKARIREVMAAIGEIRASGALKVGDVLCESIAGTGARLMVTRCSRK